MRGAQLIKDLVIKHKFEGVRGLNESMALLNHMKKFGTITTFKFLRDPLTRENTGMAYVSYMHYDDAQQALEEPEQVVKGLIEPFNTINISPYHQHKPHTK